MPAVLSFAAMKSQLLPVVRVRAKEQRLLSSWESGASSPAAPSDKAKTSRRSYNSLNVDTPFQLCFVRHGQSTWNRDNRFIGWSDTPLTDTGVLEARVAGQMLRQAGMLFDEVHTSLLRRSIRTANLCLMELGQEYIPVYKSYRLNERHYGDLVGRNKKEAVMMHGKDQVKRWRRSYDEPPPPMANDHPYNPALDPRYRLVSLLLKVSAYLARRLYVLLYISYDSSLARLPRYRPCVLSLTSIRFTLYTDAGQDTKGRIAQRHGRTLLSILG